MKQPIIHQSETLGVGSIEDFLMPVEMADLAAVMDAFLQRTGVPAFADHRTDSIHEIPGLTTRQAMAVYEPAGRVEVAAIPPEAEAILHAAFARARPALARVMPSITAVRPWTYVEYGPGQHITAHLDGIAPDPMAWPRQIAGISIVIDDQATGGGFFVETTSSRSLWDRKCTHGAAGYAPGTWLAHDGADNSADWFRDMSRTRWTVNPAPGTALLYGSQLTHGTEPVVTGRARKFISWLIADGN